MGTSERLLAGSSFDGETFTDVDLSDADLSDKELCQCTFRGVKLPRTRWARTRLEDCVFEACDLSGMIPKQMAARGVRFDGCKLTSVDWAELANFPDLAFRGCDLRYVTFVAITLKRVPFVGCKLTEATFAEADLGGAVFEDSDLTGAVFERCDLRKADFSKATGALFDPSKNQSRDAKVNGETAMLLAASLGLRVTGAAPEPLAPSRAGRRR